MRSALSTLLLVAAMGCSNTLAPSSIDGRWATPFTVPGSSFEMDLVANGSVISGTGAWSGEACCSGTVAVTGTIENATVHLDIVQTVVSPPSGFTDFSHFDGSLFVDGILRGTIMHRDPANQQPAKVSYIREQ